MPFGFGLSYTSFKYEFAAPAPASADLAPLRALLAGAKKSGKGPAFPSLAAAATAAPAIQYSVKVTNTGAVDSDDVVLGFLTPPGAGKGGVPLSQLFGFERVHLKAGESTTVWLYPSLTDFALADAATGERAPLLGEYKVSFGLKQAAEHGMGYLETTLTAHETRAVVEAA